MASSRYRVLTAVLTLALLLAQGPAAIVGSITPSADAQTRAEGRVCLVNLATNTFSLDTDPSGTDSPTEIHCDSSLTYTEEDFFQIEGRLATLATWEARLSLGDEVIAEPGGPFAASTFTMTDNTPNAPIVSCQVADGVVEVDVMPTEPSSQGLYAAFAIERTQSGGVTVLTAVTDADVDEAGFQYWDLDLPPGDYRYRAAGVIGGDQGDYSVPGESALCNPGMIRAQAGAPQRASFGELIHLRGTAEGILVTPVFGWRQTSGALVGLSEVADASGISHVTFTAPPEVSTLAFTLTVNDGERTSSGQTTVTIFEDLTAGKAVFVSPLGNDSATGTAESPVRTLAHAVAQARLTGADLYLQEGGHELSGTLELSNGLSVYGGFVATGHEVCSGTGASTVCQFVGTVGGWTRTATRPTRIHGTTQPLLLRDISVQTVINGLVVESADAIEVGPGGAGMNSIPLVVRNATSALVIEKNSFAAGRGARGRGRHDLALDGRNGGGGAEATAGVAAGTVAGSGAGGSGGLGGLGGVGPAGVGPNVRCPSGGNGGQGVLITLAGSPGSPGDGPGGGAGGAGGAGESTFGKQGGPGAAGASAEAGGRGGGAGTLVDGQWEGARGGQGEPGGFGSGGGGGGGGSGALGYGGGGGGGGGGGCGGEPGQGGFGGGASIGVLFDAASPRLWVNTISTLGGGPGGPGGNGGCGGTRGPGASGGSGAGAGGGGAAGGAGGTGSGGGGGGGGISAAFVLLNGSSPETFATDTGDAGKRIGPGGLGGGGGQTPTCARAGPAGEDGRPGPRFVPEDDYLEPLPRVIGAGQTTVFTAPVGLPGPVVFGSRWSGSDIVLSLTSPSGRKIGRNTTDADVQHVLVTNFESYRVNAAEAGTWTLELFGADVPAAGEEVTVVVTPLPTNATPMADAGPDVVVEMTGSLSAVSLTGSRSSDPDGDALAFVWQDESGTLIGAARDLSLQLPRGVRTFRLTVDDTKGGTSVDSVRVEIRDSTAPRTTDNAPTGWQRAPLTVTLTCVDPHGAGCARTDYRVDGEATHAGTSIAIAVDGDHSIHYHSIDVAGNVEAERNTRVMLDATAPTITYLGNRTSYTVDQAIAIMCQTSDALSGVASTTCADITSPAYAFALGTNSVSATTTDHAGNTTSATIGFVVTVTPTSLCTLTYQFVQSSAKYAALSPTQRNVANRLAANLCAKLDRITAKLSPAQKTALIADYKQGVDALVSQGWLTAAQGTILKSLADAL